MSKRHYLLIALSLGVLTFNGALSAKPTAQLNVVYPHMMRDQDEENIYPIALLNKALEHSGYDYTLNSSTKSMVQSRSLKQLQHNQEINVVWSMTTKQREQDLKPIRIPIFKGLYGWRLLFARKQDLTSLSGVKNVEQLKQLHFIQGHDWPDTDILIENNYIVSTSIDYSSLFSMLEKGRGDVFPRSLLEVETELANDHGDLELVVLPHIMLQYPSAIYFFFNKDDTLIANAIEQGLTVMLENGEFDKLFNQFHSAAIEHANLQDKTLYKLENSQLPELTPLQDKRLWFRGNHQ